MGNSGGRGKIAGSCAVVLLAAGGCGLDGARQPVAVVEVIVDSPQDRSLEVIVSSCHRDPGVAVLDEAAERVEISVEARTRGSTGMDCLDTLLVDLEAPIGDRPVYDRVGGQELRPSMP